MSAVAVDYTYRYVGSSHLDEPTGGLRLSTFSNGDEAHPYFFQGHLVRPKRTAEMLRALMHILQARFHLPAAMLARVVSLSDPVVTCSDERFSGYCGVYVRIDLLPPAVLRRYGRKGREIARRKSIIICRGTRSTRPRTMSPSLHRHSAG